MKLVGSSVYCLLLIAVLGACARPGTINLEQQGTAGPLRSESYDPFNIEYQFETSEEGQFVNLGTQQIPESAYVSDPSFLDKASEIPPVPESPVERFSPLLKEQLAKLPEGALDRQRISISFEDNIELPYFAETVGNEPADSSANLQVIARNNELIRQIEATRKPTDDKRRAQLERAGVTVIETSWLSGAITAEAPLQIIPSLLAIEDLLYITSLDETSPPPITVAQGRATINSDSFYNMGTPINNGGMIALIDTGVRESHTLISQGSYSRVRDQFNCYSSTTCTSQASTFKDPCNHGTSSAAIMSGNTTNNNLRGVTGIGIDAYIMYPPTTNCGGAEDDARRAIRAAINRGHKLIVAEMQTQVGPQSALTLEAKGAFQTGAVVIAANGNTGQVSNVGAPANGDRVIGVGINGGGHKVGPVEGRNKPDILAPSYAVTADSASDTATNAFGGTSGATPFAAGAAAMVRLFYQDNYGLNDPGQTYAYLIASGNDPYPFTASSGAGLLRIGENSQFSTGKINLYSGQTVLRTINITSPANHDYLKVGIWWPDNATHSNINLALVNPNGTVVATSNGTTGVFEMVKANTPMLGKWTVRIIGQYVSGTQNVYYTIKAKR